MISVQPTARQIAASESRGDRVDAQRGACTYISMELVAPHRARACQYRHETPALAVCHDDSEHTAQECEPADGNSDGADRAPVSRHHAEEQEPKPERRTEPAAEQGHVRIDDAKLVREEKRAADEHKCQA
jgi:hypothetical protein